VVVRIEALLERHLNDGQAIGEGDLQRTPHAVIDASLRVVFRVGRKLLDETQHTLCQIHILRSAPGGFVHVRRETIEIVDQLRAARNCHVRRLPMRTDDHQSLRHLGQRIRQVLQPLVRGVILRYTRRKREKRGVSNTAQKHVLDQTRTSSSESDTYRLIKQCRRSMGDEIDRLGGNRLRTSRHFACARYGNRSVAVGGS